MTLFAGGLNSETLFNRKSRDDFICRGAQSIVVISLRRHFFSLGVILRDIPFRNFIPRVCTEMTLFVGGLNSETLLSWEEPLISTTFFFLFC